MSGRPEDLSLVRKYYALKNDLSKAKHCVNPDKERIAALEMEIKKVEDQATPFMKLNKK